MRFAPLGAVAVASMLLAGLATAPRAASAGHMAAASTVPLTAKQIAAGNAAFETNCSTCHGAQLEGGAGPALMGPNFKILSSKVHATVGDVFGYMTSAMPMNAPASLKHDQYVVIMAFVLSKNGYKAGATPLTFAGASASKAPVVKN